MTRRCAVVLAAVLGLLLGAVPAAWAHATVTATNPGDGSVIAAAPHAVSVTFDEPVELQFGALRVFDPAGRRVDDGSAAHAPGHADTVITGVRAGLGRGTYTVSWRVVSADSHPVAGAFTFSVGAASTSAVDQAKLAAPGSRAVGVLFAIARWLAYAGFVMLAGAAVFLFACWPAGAANRRARLLLLVSAAALFTGTAASLLLQGPYAAGLGVAHLFDGAVVSATLQTRLGQALVARLVLLAGAELLLGWSIRRLPQAPRWVVVAGGVLVAGTAATWPLADHAGTGIQVPLAFPVTVVHLSAAAVWLGGLAMLAGVLLPRAEVKEIAHALPRFSRIAFGCVVVLAVTGTYQTWRQVGTLPALTSTTYGRLLLVKICAFGLLIGLGYLARLWIAQHLKPGRPPRIEQLELSRLRRSIGIEVGVGVAVLALTAVLVNAQPARSAYAAPVTASVAFDTGGPSGTGTVNLIVDPAKVGANAIHLYILTATGQEEQVAQVQAALLLPAQQLGPLPVPLTNAGPGHYLATAPIPISGRWQLQITVRTDDINETTVSVPVEVR